MTSMAYAKYLYTSHYNCTVEQGDHIDHINGNKIDDRFVYLLSHVYSPMDRRKH